MQAGSADVLTRDASRMLSTLLLVAQKSLQLDPSSAQRCIERAVDILARIDRPDHPVATQPYGGLSLRRMNRIRRFIDEAMDQPLSSSELAAAAGLSSSRFIRAFKASAGVTPHQYLIRARIERAKALMLTSADALSDIALACGMADQSHFSRLFHKLEGEPPAAWRRRQVQDA